MSLLGAAVVIAVSRQLSAVSRDTAGWDLAIGYLPLLLPAVDVFSGTFQPWRGPVLLLGGLALTLLNTRRVPAKRHSLSHRAGFVIAVALPLLVYLTGLSPYVGRADTFEFQVTALRLGIAHPTGYPLYVLLGKLFTLLPLGTLAWKVNLTSAVCAAGATGLVYLLIYRITRHSTIAVLAALALAWSSTVWSQAVIAEVYALNLLFVAGALWLILDILEERSMPATLWRAALLMGLSLTNHITMVMLIPALGLACLLRWPRLRLNDWLKAAGLFALGLAVYAYIPLRWPALHDGQWMSLPEFLAYITGRQFGGALQLGLLRDPTRYAILWRLLRGPFGVVGLALAAIGLLHLTVKQWRIALVSLAAFLPYGFYALVYLVPDIDVFIIPAHLLLAVWIGIGTAQIANGASRITHHVSRITYPVLIPLLALLPLSLLWRNLPLHNARAEGEADEAWGRYVLAQPLASNAAILADSEKFPPLYYLQQAEGMRPDLDMVMRFDEAGYVEELHTRLAAGQRVYLARYLPGMDAYGVSAVGPLVEIAPPEKVALAPATPMMFDDTLALITHKLEIDPQERRMHHLTLTWEPAAPVTQDLIVQLRLLTPDGKIAWSSGGQRPVNGYSTTQAWRASQRIDDYYALAWPDWVPGGDYRLEMALAPRFSTDLLAPGWVALDKLALPWAVAPRGSTQPALFYGALWLEGYDLPGEVAADSPLIFTLTWLGTGDLPEDAQPHFYWMPLDNARWEPPIIPESLPPNIWPENQPVQQRYTVNPQWLPGQYRLWVGWSAAGRPLTARCRWLARPDVQCALGNITVGPSATGLANFGGQVMLVDAALDAANPAPGATLPLMLRWRALRALTENYTVFAQIVGPEGKLYGQVDSWPVYGTRPTGGWRSGEEINDPYQLNLAPDAPPGEYQVIIGWYLLGTMERLAVLDANGQAVGDYYVVGRFTVGE
ncbi:MAG: glycosyltransferase family 117 protein [Anaerolineae bacterium]